MQSDYRKLSRTRLQLTQHLNGEDGLHKDHEHTSSPDEQAKDGIFLCLISMFEWHYDAFSVFYILISDFKVA